MSANTAGHRDRRANILEINLDGSGERIFAWVFVTRMGWRWEPRRGALDGGKRARRLGRRSGPRLHHERARERILGSAYSYFGQNKDPPLADLRPDLVARAIVPDYALGSHTAALGLVFYTGRSFPERYRVGAFVAMRDLGTARSSGATRSCTFRSVMASPWQARRRTF